MIHSYPSIYNLGHKAVLDIFRDPVVIQEKVDGSQISFGVLDFIEEANVPGHALRIAVSGGVYALEIRSKGAPIVIPQPDKMFKLGVNYIVELAAKGLLTPGWIYRGEYLQKPKHNSLAYDRIPANHTILFDIDRGNQDYVDPGLLFDYADRMGLESVPLLSFGSGFTQEHMAQLLDTPSILGGQKIEGVVIKSTVQFGVDKKVLMAKFVSEAFKEVHRKGWKLGNPSSADVIDNLIAQYRTPARWDKAVQHMRDLGELQDDPRDIGPLLKEIAKDIHAEDMDVIKDALFEWAWPKMHRGLTSGFADWYKARLLDKQFERRDEGGEA